MKDILHLKHIPHTGRPDWGTNKSIGHKKAVLLLRNGGEMTLVYAYNN